jgi:opacity protein-like surface antigen
VRPACQSVFARQHFFTIQPSERIARLSGVVAAPQLAGFCTTVWQFNLLGMIPAYSPHKFEIRIRGLSMRHAISFCAAAALLGCASAASAADMPARMPTKAPVAPVVVAYNWSGFYIGAHVGGVWGDKDWRDTIGPLGSHDVSGLLAGGQIGFNWQSGNWVFGIEAQASWTNADGRHDTPTTFFTTEVKWLGTIAGRIGWARDRLLLYVKGGAAFAHDEHGVGTNIRWAAAWNTASHPIGRPRSSTTTWISATRRSRSTASRRFRRPPRPSTSTSICTW